MMELAYFLIEDANLHFQDRLDEAIANGWGVYLYENVVFLSTCNDNFYFVNVTRFLKTSEFAVYTYNDKNLISLVRLPFNRESFIRGVYDYE